MASIASTADAGLRNPDGLDPERARRTALLLVAAASAALIWVLPQGLSAQGRLSLVVTVLAVLGWTATRLPESLVALLAGLALVLGGALPAERLFATLGSELVWLLIAAFVIAAAIKECGLLERLLAPLAGKRPSVTVLFWTLTLAIAATAFVLPSTSGRAALLLPVFLALVPALPDRALVRPLALLFPTAILLSAGGSLIGAGAHLIAVEAIRATTGLRLDYLGWLLLAGPPALLSALAGTALLLLGLPRPLRRARLLPIAAPAAADARQRRVAFLLAALVLLWIAEPWHGIGPAVVALAGALLLLAPPLAARKPKEVLRCVDLELLLFMAATLVIAEAMTASGADRWLAEGALAVLPAALAADPLAIALLLATVAVLAHLVVTSRSARAAVLVPALALPAAGLGHDPALTVLIVTLGSGFCQTLMASAKPVAIFGTQEGSFEARDLVRLALPLAPLVVLLLVAFALLVWPARLAALRGPAPVQRLAEPPASTAAAPGTGAIGATTAGPRSVEPAGVRAPTPAAAAASVAASPTARGAAGPHRPSQSARPARRSESKPVGEARRAGGGTSPNSPGRGTTEELPVPFAGVPDALGARASSDWHLPASPVRD